MANRSREEEKRKLIIQIKEWNAHRLDIFALSEPNEDLEFFGVMRFYYQAVGEKVATKCIRVSSTATTKDVLGTLVEKFRPDMRMLSLPLYTLYEVHVNGEERRLKEQEKPLLVQFHWGADIREGRFLLKNEEDKTQLLKSDIIANATDVDQHDVSNTGSGFKRKLSKREKKELKKKEKEAKLKGKENESPASQSGVAEKLYTELPETSFTRSISNPESVMRRRRQQKLEKKLQQFKSRDGGPDTGGTLKIYGASINKDVPYKTLLLSTMDTVAHVVKETLTKYGMEKEDPDSYCLVQSMHPPGGSETQEQGWGKDYILEDDDCPLSILMHTHTSKELHPPPGWTVIFSLRPRPANMPKRKKKRSSSTSRMDQRGAGRMEEPGAPPQYTPYDPRAPPPDKLPFLVEVNPDGSEPFRARTFRLPLNVTEVGSEQKLSQGGQYLWLPGQDIFPRHCVVTFTEGIVTLTPTSNEAETSVNNKRIFETTMLQHGMVVCFGHGHFFRYCDPTFEEKQGRPPASREHAAQQHSAPYNNKQPPPDVFETTFDVDGHIETVAGPQDGKPDGPQPMDTRGPQESGLPVDGLLPASIEYSEENQFLYAAILNVKGATVQFKLAPTYTLYMAVRYVLSRLSSSNMRAEERQHWLNDLMVRIASMVRAAIEESQNDAGSLSFWMANASELLHFLKQDQDTARCSREAQDVLAQAVQVAFDLLVDCMRMELHKTMPVFLDESLDDLQNEGAVLQVLSSTMSLLRRCRVNAALTIQLFSQLFHFVNMWLFNKLVTEPGLRLCTSSWGHRLKRRLNRVEIWAEKHGLELAADCHLARIIQAAHLLEAPKSDADHVVTVSSSCFKLNSMQLKALLENYDPGPGEARIPQDLINSVVAVAQSTADELTRSDGREVRLEEEPDLQLPFLLPEDGYSCDIIKGLPSGLAEFLDPIAATGLCRMKVNPNASGQWTVYMPGAPQNHHPENLRATGHGGPAPGHPSGGPGSGSGGSVSPHSPTVDSLPAGLPKDPEVMHVTFNKVNRSIGLSIVAAIPAKSEAPKERGIYVKSVVPGGGAAIDGRLQAGDLLLEVDGNSLVGLTQEKAAELMTRTGQTVTLRIAKQGALYHGLASTLSQPSPVMPRASPQQDVTPNKTRPHSEEVSRYGMPPMAGSPVDGQQRGRPLADGSRGGRPLNLQHGARSSPHLAAPRSHEQVPDNDPYGANRGYYPPQGDPHPARPIDPRETAVRSKSTSNLDRPDPRDVHDHRHASSTSTLPLAPPQQQQQQQPHHPHHQMQQHPQQQPTHPAPMQPGSQKFASQPNLNRPRDEPPHHDSHRDRDYENFPQAFPPKKPPREEQQADDRYRTGPPPPQQSNYMNQSEVNAQYHRDLGPVRGSQSMSNIKEDQGRGNLARPMSEELDHSRVREWQQRNEMAMGPYDSQQQDVPYADREVPRSQAGGGGSAGHPQQQMQIQQNSAPRKRAGNGGAPQFNQTTSSSPGMAEDPRLRPSVGPKPATPSKHPGLPEEVPRQDAEHRRSGHYDAKQHPHHQQQQVEPDMPRGSASSYPQHPGYPGGPPHAKGAPQHRADQQYPGGRDLSPDLPPPPPPDMPPDLPPPPEDLRHHYGEELPPPPPSGSREYAEQQIREEQERMMKRFDSVGGRSGAPPGRQQHDSRSPHQQQAQQTHPGRAPTGPEPTHANYQNLPTATDPRQQQHPFYTQSPTKSTYESQPSQPQTPQKQQEPNHNAYPYTPRPAPPSDHSSLSGGKPEPTTSANRNSIGGPPPNKKPPPPPVSAKPKLLAAEAVAVRKATSPSPWERDQRELQEKQRQEDVRQAREQQMRELEAKPYLTHEETERMRRLRLDQEFERRVQETNDKDKDGGGDSDPEMTESAAGRAQMLQLLQQDMEKRQLQLVEDKQQRAYEKERADREKQERQERRLHQFEQEREEQRARQARRQEQKAHETEEYLKKQRDLREKQRAELEEQRRQQRLEEEKYREKQRDELRRKKEMEREQMREIQAAREMEEAAMRDAAAKRQQQEADEAASRKRALERLQQEQEARQRAQQEQEARQRAQQEQEDKARRDFEQSTRAQYAPPQQPSSRGPGAAGGQVNQAPPVPHGGGAGYAPPAPPERKSSYDAYRSGTPNMDSRTGSMTPPRSMNSSALRQPDGSSAKKSVSFNQNLATEIEYERRYFGSTSSDGSYMSPPVQQPEQEVQYPPQYPYRVVPGNAPPPPVPNSAPPPLTNPVTPTTPSVPVAASYNTSQTSNVDFLFQDRTPEHASEPPPSMVAGSTPGVIGAQEIYRDPRDRIAATKTTGLPADPRYPTPDRMSFRDKMKMFAKEAGENTPQDRPKISKAQQAIETDMNGR